MGKQTRRAVTTPLLLILTALDIGYAIVALAFPRTWFRQIHGTEYVDPQGLLRRTGALWAAFALVQGLASFRWRRERHWLMAVAGVRSTELIADWAYLGFAKNTRKSSAVGLALSPLLNALCIAYFYLSYFKERSPSSR